MGGLLRSIGDSEELQPRCYKMVHDAHCPPGHLVCFQWCILDFCRQCFNTIYYSALHIEVLPYFIFAAVLWGVCHGVGSPQFYKSFNWAWGTCWWISDTLHPKSLQWPSSLQKPTNVSKHGVQQTAFPAVSHHLQKDWLLASKVFDFVYSLSILDLMMRLVWIWEVPCNIFEGSGLTASFQLNSALHCAKHQLSCTRNAPTISFWRAKLTMDALFLNGLDPVYGKQLLILHILLKIPGYLRVQ